MYPDPFYYTGGAQYPPYPPMVPPENPDGFPFMPFPEPVNAPGGGFGFPPVQGYPFQSFSPPPPDFSGFYPGY